MKMKKKNLHSASQNKHCVSKKGDVNMYYINDFITHFEGVKKTGPNQYIAKCPAHGDEHPSLSIGLSRDQSHIVINCFVGCSTQDILESAGLQMRDLYPEETRQKAASQVILKKEHQYRDENGTLVYTKTRNDYADGHKAFFFEQPNGQKSVKGAKRVLYNLPAVLRASTVYFVEGEKCADAVIAAGCTATTLDTGAKSPWCDRYTEYLQGKNVIVLPDNDEPGMQYAKRVLKHIPTAKIIQLPDLPPKGDVYDWLHAGHTMDEITSLPLMNIGGDSTTDDDIEEEQSPRKTQAEVLLDLVEENGAILFHDTANDLYAAVLVDGHREIMSIDSNDFSAWLTRLYYNHCKKPIRKDNLTQALAVISAKAKFDCEEPIMLWNRVAKSENAFWYDFTNPNWQAAKITADRWTIEENTPILFNRYRHQSAQAQPSNKGDLRKILKYINIKENHTLFLCWLVSCFVPDIPHAMPIFFGEKGAAKSTTCSLLKQLIDPSVLDTLTIQNNMRSLTVNLQQHWFLPFDNVSHINGEISDTLCRAITGGGIQQRKLHTNAEDYIFTFKRCLALNGINNVATRSDLLDRSILIELERIPEEERRELCEVQEAFKADLPYILGGIFDVLSAAMKRFPDVKLKKLPRMADFARWGYAIAEALGADGEIFIKEYTSNQQQQNIEILNSDVVAVLMMSFMDNKQEWEGLVSELFISLSDHAPTLGMTAKTKGFPARPNSLSRALNGLRSNLQSVGITFTSKQTAKGTQLTVLNKNLSPLPSYRIEMPSFKGKPNGDLHGDAMEINDEDGDNEDDSVTF